jgi:hypothetical protein
MAQTLYLLWDRRRLCGLVADGTQIAESFAHDWPDDFDPLQSPVQTAEEIRNRLSSRWSPQRTVVCLSREDVILRHFDVPDVPDDELAAMVAFQAAARSAQPLEQLLLDFLPLPKVPGHTGRPVLTVTAARSLIQSLTAVLSAAGLEADCIAFSSVGIAEYVVQTDRQRGHDSREAILAVVKDGSRLELVIVSQQQMIQAHAARLPAGDQAPALLAEVSRTLIAAQQHQPGLAIRRIWLLDREDDAADVASRLAERIGAPASLLSPADLHWAIDTGRQLAELSPFLAALVGLTVPPADRLSEPFDLLHPRRPPKKIDARKLRLAVGSAAALVISAMLMGWIQWTKTHLERRIEELRSRETDLDLKIKPGQSALAAAKLIEDWQAGNLNQLEHLASLEDVMDGTSQLYLTQYVFTAGQGEALGNVQAFGNAKTREDVQRFNQRLIDTKAYRIHPRGLTQSSRDDEYPHRFELNADLLPKAKD